MRKIESFSKSILKNLSSSLLSLFVLILPIFTIGCEQAEKEDLKSKSNSLPDKVVYFEGIGDLEVKFNKSPQYFGKLIQNDNYLIMKKFVQDAKELNFYLDEDGKIYAFKTNKASINFIKNRFQLQERCSPNYNANVTYKFFKHIFFSTEFVGLRRTGNFSIPNVNIANAGSNDEISSLTVDNQRKEHNYLVTLYKDADFQGWNVKLGVQRCSAWGEVGNMKNTWFWFDHWTGNWEEDGPFNDKASSIIGSTF
jgi:hypothetical protein